MENKMSSEQTDRLYKALLTTVEFLNRGKPDRLTEEVWLDFAKRTKDYLRGMLAKPFWTTEDLEPLRQAAA